MNMEHHSLGLGTSRPRSRKLSRRSTQLLRVTAALFALGLLTGCASSASEDLPPIRQDLVIGQILAKAEEDPLVDDRQLEVLRDANAAQEVTYEQLDSLVESALVCMERAGVEAFRTPDIEIATGFKAPAYSFAEEGRGLADRCIARYSIYAEEAYHLQPVVTEAKDVALLANRDQVIECLGDHGKIIDSEATLAEIRQATIDLFLATADTERVLCSDDF